MVKEIIAISIIVFWLAYPFGMIIQNSNSYINMDLSDIENINSPDNFNIIQMESLSMWDYISIYFRAMYQTIPNSPPFISLIIIMLQIISALIIYLLVRGG